MVISPNSFDITEEDSEKLMIKSIEDNVNYLSSHISDYKDDCDY